MDKYDDGVVGKFDSSLLSLILPFDIIPDILTGVIVVAKVCMIFYRCNKMIKFFLKNMKNVTQT